MTNVRSNQLVPSALPNSRQSKSMLPYAYASRPVHGVVRSSTGAQPGSFPCHTGRPGVQNSLRFPKHATLAKASTRAVGVFCALVVGVVVLLAVGSGIARAGSRINQPGRIAATSAHFVEAPSQLRNAPGGTKVVVSQGDTLWSLARSAKGGGDVPRLVARIAKVNKLKSSTLSPGTVLIMPAP